MRLFGYFMKKEDIKVKDVLTYEAGQRNERERIIKIIKRKGDKTIKIDLKKISLKTGVAKLKDTDNFQDLIKTLKE